MGRKLFAQPPTFTGYSIFCHFEKIFNGSQHISSLFRRISSPFGSLYAKIGKFRPKGDRTGRKIVARPSKLLGNQTFIVYLVFRANLERICANFAQILWYFNGFLFPFAKKLKFSTKKPKISFKYQRLSCWATFQGSGVELPTLRNHLPAKNSSPNPPKVLQSRFPPRKFAKITKFSPKKSKTDRSVCPRPAGRREEQGQKNVAIVPSTYTAKRRRTNEDTNEEKIFYLHEGPSRIEIDFYGFSLEILRCLRMSQLCDGIPNDLFVCIGLLGVFWDRVCGIRLVFLLILVQIEVESRKCLNQGPIQLFLSFPGLLLVRKDVESLN